MPKDMKNQDKKNKMTANEIKKRELKKRENTSSDSDDSSEYESEDEKISKKKYNLIKELFPSKYINKKVKAEEKLRALSKNKNKKNKKSNSRCLEEESEESEEYDDDDSESEESEEDHDSDESDEEEESESEDDRNKKRRYNTRSSSAKKDEKKTPDNKKSKGKSKKLQKNDSSDSSDEEEYESNSKKFNIILSVNEKEYDDDDGEWEEYFSDEDDDEETENEDDDISDSDEEDDDEEDDNDYDEESDAEDLKRKKDKSKPSIKNKKSLDKEKKTRETKSNKNDTKNGKDKESKSNSTSNLSVMSQIKTLFESIKEPEPSAEIQKEKEQEGSLQQATPHLSDEDLLKGLKEIQKRNADNNIINECVTICQKTIDTINKKTEKRTKKLKERNARIYQKIVNDKNTMSDFKFYDTLPVDNQIKIIKELREINKITRVEKPYRLTLLESNIPTIFKASAFKKIGSLKYMEPGSGEYYKVKNWVDNFMRIPFGKYHSLPVKMSDGVDSSHEFMKNAKDTLDKAVYGLNDAKMQIMQMLGQLITNPASIGTSISINGPPGSGKTSLIKDGVSKILNRPFAFIALGGATDSSFLEGHSYTYEGSIWGKIVQILIDSQCMNPVIYFDELDKISDTPKGEEILNILVHLTDTTQNSQFHDKYFNEIDFDLSRCLFIFSYNDESKINPILLDRMYKIKTNGYSNKEKTIIVNDYLLPKIREQIKFESSDIIISNEVLQYIIENYTSDEKGVRNIKRCLEIIYSKLNLFRLMKPEKNLFDDQIKLHVTFPYTLDKSNVDKLIKKNETVFNFKDMYV
jgi:ATP-dependent Lon protease